MAATSGRIYVHAGMPKTGTSYLQSIFHGSRKELARQGLGLAPPTRRENFWLSLAVREGLDPGRDPAAALQILERFSDQVRSSEDQTLLLSDELLGGASADQVECLMEACRPREVHLVLTVRGLARLLPSTWQQRIQQGSEAPALEEFLDAVASKGGSIGERWWDERGIQNVIDRWSHHLPLARVHVVTVPRGSSSEELLRRFCDVLGVDASQLPTGAAKQNASLGHAEAEVLRLVREHIPPELLDRHGYVPLGKRWLAHRHLAPLGGPPARMPTRLRTWCEEEAEAAIDYLGSRPVNVVGDLQDLRPRPDDFHDGPPVASDRLLEVAVRALASIALERLEEQRNKPEAPKAASPAPLGTRARAKLRRGWFAAKGR